MEIEIETTIEALQEKKPEEIELVIKIRKDLVENADYIRKFDEHHLDEIGEALKNAAQLPKGHGKIVDIDKLIDSKCNECGHIRGVSCTIPCYAVRRMLDAQTIVEADKESWVSE